jgi:ElaB/YqjD/DUF883 family membrane-anchored ribosome-binding protein
MHKTTHRNSKLHAVEYDLQHDWEKIKDALLGTSHDLTGKASQLISQSVDGFKEKSVDMKDGVSTYIAEKPFKSLGITLLAGVCIGYFFSK